MVQENENNDIVVVQCYTHRTFRFHLFILFIYIHLLQQAVNMLVKDPQCGVFVRIFATECRDNLDKQTVLYPVDLTFYYFVAAP